VGDHLVSAERRISLKNDVQIRHLKYDRNLSFGRKIRSLVARNSLVCPIWEGAYGSTRQAHGRPCLAPRANLWLLVDDRLGFRPPVNEYGKVVEKQLARFVDMTRGTLHSDASSAMQVSYILVHLRSRFPCASSHIDERTRPSSKCFEVRRLPGPRKVEGAPGSTIRTIWGPRYGWRTPDLFRELVWRGGNPDGRGSRRVPDPDHKISTPLGITPEAEDEDEPPNRLATRLHGATRCDYLLAGAPRG